MHKKPPAAYFQLSLDGKVGLEQYLARTERLAAGERIELVEKAGEGNMNCVLRVCTNQRSFILKQSLPWVFKYPNVPAPIGRISVEARFYDRVRTNDTWKRYTPEIHWFDESQHLLCMQDFGPSSDFTSIYKKGNDLNHSDVADLAKVISELHAMPNSDTRVDNMAMRSLNHQHIFDLPLNPNNQFDLDSVQNGLQLKTQKFRTDKKLKKNALALGEIYLSNEGYKMLHGDYYPGSWLRTTSGLKIIDPEFCFHGRAEFELAVTMAHLKLARQSNSIMKDLFLYYHFDSHFDGSLFSRFAGMEMIRRLIGLAQLPLELELNERLNLLDEAYELVMHG